MLTAKCAEVLWEVLLRVLWEIGVLQGVLPWVLRRIGDAPASALKGAQCGGLNRKSTLGSTCSVAPESSEHPWEHPSEHPNFPGHPREHFKGFPSWHTCARSMLLQCYYKEWKTDPVQFKRGAQEGTLWRRIWPFLKKFSLSKVIRLRGDRQAARTPPILHSERPLFLNPFSTGPVRFPLLILSSLKDKVFALRICLC